MVRILGGGFSGLTLAEALSERGIPFEIYEAQDRLGGLLKTETLKNGLAEAAANGILWSPELEALCQRLNLKMIEVKKTAKARWIYSEGKARRWPLGFFSSLKLIGVFLRYKWNADSLRPEPGTLLQDYAHEKLGTEVTNRLLKPALQGIYGPCFENLSASLVLGKLFDRHRRRIKPRTVSFSGGLQDLIDALAEKVRARGTVHLNQAVDLSKMNPSVGPTIICTDLSTASRLVHGPRFETSGLVSVTVIASETPASLRGFGCLFSDMHESEGALGVLFNSEIFVNRAVSTQRSETWIYDSRKVASLSDAELLKKTLDLRKKLLKEDGAPREHKVWRWPAALPVYSIGLEKWLRSIGPFGEFALAGTSIRLHGNYGGEIGLSSILQRSQILAEKIARMT